MKPIAILAAHVRRKRNIGAQNSYPACDRWPFEQIFLAMSTKEIVADLIQRLPEDVSLIDVAREIEFVAAVRQGIDELDRGEGISLSSVQAELPSWIIR